jgi:phenylacetate-CoA ligase
MGNERTPLMTAAGEKNLKRIREHEAAPRWNVRIGDRLEKEDLAYYASFRNKVLANEPFSHTVPPHIVQWIELKREKVALFREAIPHGFDIAKDWAHIPTMSREDIACRPEDIVPQGESLDRLIVYDTSGTTGHALVVPHHPRAVALNHALAESVLKRHGIETDFSSSSVACLNICAQRKTHVFCNVFSVWNEAGFAKINLNPKDWAGGRKAARKFILDLAPIFITADPVSLAELMKWQIPIKPSLIISTALTLSKELQRSFESYFDCPVVNWYSTTETGPIAASIAGKEGLFFLAPDLYVEIIDEDGIPLPIGEIGEITVTGGRNPYLPLLRYRTGDFGKMADSPLRLTELVGRKLVFFRATDGSMVNPVDISREMRLVCPFVQHEFIQKKDGSCVVKIRPAVNANISLKAMTKAIKGLFGQEQKVEVLIDENLGKDNPSGKVISWQSELELETE